MTEKGLKLSAPSSQVKFAAFITAICLLGDMMLYVVLPIHWEQFGLLSLWEVGVLLSINRFVRIPLHPIVNQFYKKFSLKQGFMIGLVLTVLSTIAYGVLKSFWPLLLARVLWGIAWTFLRQGGQLIVVEAAMKTGDAGRLSGLYNGLSRSGALVGMLVGGACIDLIGVEWISLIFGIVALICIPLLITSNFGYSVNYDEMAHSSNDAHHLKKKQVFIYLLISTFFITFIFQGVLKSTLGLWVDERDFTTLLLLGALGPAALTAVLLTFSWGMEPLISPLVGKWRDRSRAKERWLITGLGLAAVFYAIVPLSLPVSTWIMVIIILLILSTLITMLLDATMAEYAVTAKTSKHKVISNYLMVSDLGAAAGPMLGFMIIEMAGASMVAWGAAGLILTVALILGKVERSSNASK
ncbi:MFS transporter [Halalkalibacter sp. AB-rgal2]|uniref:MFS transporter n=1 Tax=Halalkalibacter sp. AB-rgal2 TaxID=3242695 RepID=UPI00359E0866